jgi:hypothetical protein
MLDVTALKQFREQRFFAGWVGSVAPESVAASEQTIRALIDSLVALGPAAPETAVQEAVHDCVERFNELDQGWISTIEREDICDCLSRVVELCGLDSSADWIAENREW